MSAAPTAIESPEPSTRHSLRAARGSAVTFDAETHTYTVNGRVLPSVTTVLRSLKIPFDAQGIAAKVAVRDGLDVSTVLAQWESKRDRALTRGKSVHRAIEAHLSGIRPTDESAEYRMWKQWWSGTMTPVAVEHIIADEQLGCAGTVDAVLWSPKTRLLHVFDWKTGDAFKTENRFGDRLLSPFDDLDACELESYSLQVSLYRLMLERQGNDCGDSWIVHLTANGALPYRAYDYRKRLREWLAANPPNSSYTP